MNTENTIKKIGTVAVLGAGNMGNQITESLVRIAGYKVNIMDISMELANKGIEAIDSRLEKHFVAKGKMSTDDKKAVMGKIKAFASVEEVAKGADYVIEAVIENLALKKDIFKKLDEVTRPDVILTSNTSMLNITEMASATRKPEKVAGMHFFNPVAMKVLGERS